METMKAIALRKSTRAYKPDQIPGQVLDEILAAGCAAPVGMAQYDTMHLTVIQDKQILRRISEDIAKGLKRDGDATYGVPTIVLISAKEEQLAEGLDYTNAGCIMENMLLAATDKGIGSVILWGTALAARADAELRSMLPIPAGFRPVASVGLGYPASPDTGEKELKLTIAVDRV